MIVSLQTKKHFLSMILAPAVLALGFATTGCEIDPDVDAPSKPIVPKPDDEPGKGDDTENKEDEEGTDPGDGSDENGNDDPNQDPETDPSEDEETNPGAGACFGHCDCAPNEYCAAIGTCQLRVVNSGYYCCSRLDSCPAGEPCHIEDSKGEIGICGQD